MTTEPDRSTVSNEKSPMYLVGVLMVALILRVLFYTYNASLPIKYYANTDAYNYENIAVNLMENQIYSGELVPPFIPNVSRPPVYPLFLVLIYKITGSSPSVVVFLQALIGTITVFLTFLLSRTLKFSVSTSVISALVVALDPISILHTNLLLTETLFTAVIIGGVICLYYYRQVERQRWLFLSAVLFAVGALTRPISQYLPVVLAPLFLMRNKSRSKWIGISRAAIFVIFSCGLMFIWVYRNYQVLGIWSLSDTGTYNLAYQSAEAVLESAEDISRDDAIAKIDEKIIVGEVSSTERSNAERRVAFEVFRKYPITTVIVHLEGMLKFLINPGLDNICSQLSRSNDIEGCRTAGNVPSPGLLDLIRLKFGRMNNLQLAVAGWSILFLIPLYLTSMAGVYELVRLKLWNVLLGLLLIILYFMLLSAGGVTTSRFRIPTIPYWGLLSAIGWQVWGGWLVSLGRK
ncbi:MAG: ArnT family glycosyltransferase [Anaerolineales bacterium]